MNSIHSQKLLLLQESEGLSDKSFWINQKINVNLHVSIFAIHHYHAAWKGRENITWCHYFLFILFKIW